MRSDAELTFDELARLQAGVPTGKLLTLCGNGFLVAELELTEVVARLGRRKQDLEDLLSIAKSMEVLHKKVRRLSEHLAPEVLEGKREDPT